MAATKVILMWTEMKKGSKRKIALKASKNLNDANM